MCSRNNREIFTAKCTRIKIFAGTKSSFHNWLTVPRAHVRFCALVSQLQGLSFDLHSCCNHAHIAGGQWKCSLYRISSVYRVDAPFTLLWPPTHSQMFVSYEIIELAQKKPRGHFGLDRVRNTFCFCMTCFRRRVSSTPVGLAAQHYPRKAQNGSLVLVCPS